MIAPSKNTTVAIRGDIPKGNIMKSSEKKDGKMAWTLTQTGIDYVENDFKKSK